MKKILIVVLLTLFISADNNVSKHAYKKWVPKDWGFICDVVPVPAENTVRTCTVKNCKFKKKED